MFYIWLTKVYKISGGAGFPNHHLKYVIPSIHPFNQLLCFLGALFWHHICHFLMGLLDSFATPKPSHLVVDLSFRIIFHSKFYPSILRSQKLPKVSRGVRRSGEFQQQIFWGARKRCCTSWWFQPIIWKVLCQIGSLPQIGVNIKKYVKPPPSTSLRGVPDFATMVVQFHCIKFW